MGLDWKKGITFGNLTNKRNLAISIIVAIPYTIILHNQITSFSYTWTKKSLKINKALSNPKIKHNYTKSSSHLLKVTWILHVIRYIGF